ncbi:MAG: FdtA/QdtA family cupin domain-containing protein [Candidatus Marinimicrobia bacterium]|jgi:dTDP-4-dehydrorhamnose 3,5-epimerase-like enzyme|nr:FdtA/QdtA family cupin domain-containing protein [Candidatus Neomarinimicrobiota bacterium]
MKNNNSLKLIRYSFPCIIEEKAQGKLRVFESDDLPFQVKRVFSVVNAKGGSKRGQHAHKNCNQLICCVSGEINLICDNGKNKVKTRLSPRSEAILVPSGVWAEQHYLIDNSVIIVFCDQPFNENDYIRNYKEYLNWKKEQK